MEQYQECFRLLPWVYAPGSPVIVPEGILMWDGHGGTKLAQLQIMNLGSRVITGGHVQIGCIGPSGEDLGSAVYTFGGLQAATGAVFGTGPIVLPNPMTVIMNVRVAQVTFADGSCWDGPEGIWEPLPEPKTIEMLFPDPELAREYRLAVGEPCVQAPRMYQGLFLCACGTINGDPEAPCRGCGRTFPDLAMAMNEETLRGKAEERRAGEEEARQARLAREQEAKQRRKEEAKGRRKEAGKYILIALILVVVLGVLAWVVPNVVIPEVRRSQAFSEAERLLEQGRYDEANAAFAALGDYKEADRMALESLYQKAESLREQGKYAEAVTGFENLGDYLDSAQQAEDTLILWKEGDYQAARALVDAGAYPAAAAAFEALGDYKDAPQWVFECQMLQRENDYASAQAAMDAGEYLAARELFLGLGDYRESVLLAEECRTLQQAKDYDAACAALEAKEFAVAVDLFTALGSSYADVSEKLIAAHYGNGLELMKAEDYAAAVEELSLCGDYQNTAWNLKEAKMGYARTHAVRTDAKTLAYLKELKDIYFQGAKALYDEIFGWKVEITSFSNSEWGENQETLSKFGVLYVHFKVTGGEPGESTTIRTTLTVPGGNRGTVYHNGVSDGYTGHTNFWFNDPAYAPTGTLTFQAYDEAGRLLCTGSVRVVN